ncbi:Domain of uncharacterised function (DUF955) [Mycoplasmopsis maculosa]|uniref:Domain of uncharacterized function (DUF955) n=1 Tax=Mycoplasmopsis maculosa TaxID=114885 RepID=A0A449B584_9BACT|nr:ImmA/IrrE family metallo-endopeptidase [Mycoplasmopsis maculosa]VEU75767.1 Domain of uncharacterised function (DUF955) [Mycoplasmopsis maculosa]
MNKDTTKETTKQTTKEKLFDDVETIDKELDEFILDPNKWDSFLPYLANHYSVRNNYIISKNKASIVKTLSAWNKENINIKKGEKAIWLLAPKSTKFINLDNKLVPFSKLKPEQFKNINKKDIIYKTFAGFRPFTVFDITQTDLPKEKYPKDYFNYFNFMSSNDLNIEIANKLYEYLINKIAEKYNIKVNYENLKTVSGKLVQNTNNPIIMFNTNNELRQNIRVLFHELSHFLLKHNYEKTKRGICEFEAELSAYLISAILGLKEKESSFRYIKEWSDEILSFKRDERIKSIDNALNTSRTIFKELNLDNFIDNYKL